MHSSITPYSEHRRRFGWHQLARKIILSQLNNLHTGELILVDGGERHLFGVPGSALRAEMHIIDPQTYTSILTGGSIGAAEAFMTGDWVTPELTSLVQLLVRNMDILDQMEGGVAALSRPFLKLFHRLNQNSEKGSRRNIAAHYDLGNDFFESFLDPTMMYSAGIFPTAEATMAQASFHKLETICRKLNLCASDKVVEIGTGWGGFAIHAAKYYGCHVTTTTISEEQYKLAEKRIADEGLEGHIHLLKQDYRSLEGRYDKLVSIEMIEAVGWKFYPEFFEKCSSLLNDDGVMLLQAITIQDQRYEQAKNSVDFIQRYIFPGSCIPSIHALNSAAMLASDVRLIDQEDFAEHYARTLRAWLNTFKQNESHVVDLGYSDTFRKMWEFYLCYCEGGFKERAIGVSHLMYAKPRYLNEPNSLNAVLVPNNG